MNKNSTMGIGLVLGIFSLSMIFLLYFVEQDWLIKMEKEFTQIKATSINGDYILQKKGFLIDNQIYQFISDCHDLKGKLEFDKIYSKRGTFFDLRCSN